MTTALTDGRWVRRGPVLVWDDTPLPDEVTAIRPPAPKAATLPPLIACPTCHATVTQTCRTAGGNPTADHADRLVTRRCPCGALLEPRKQWCEPCRAAARRRTYRDREIRRSTSQRRRAA